jgi:uncharacterized protein (DUF736 family)
LLKGKSMLMTVGTLTKHVDGCLAGVLRTLTVRTQIELRPVGDAVAGPNFEVLVGSGFVAGHATSRRGVIDIVLLSPELHAPLRLRAIPRPPGSDEWQVVWEPGHLPVN